MAIDQLLHSRCLMRTQTQREEMIFRLNKNQSAGLDPHLITKSGARRPIESAYAKDTTFQLKTLHTDQCALIAADQSPIGPCGPYSAALSDRIAAFSSGSIVLDQRHLSARVPFNSGHQDGCWMLLQQTLTVN